MKHSLNTLFEYKLEFGRNVSFESASDLAIIGFGLISVSLVLVIFAFMGIIWKKFRFHKYLMGLAILSNSSFLVFYIIRLITEGNTPFPGPNWFYLGIYLPILVAHIFTAIVSIFYVLRQFITGYKGQIRSQSDVLRLTGRYQAIHVKNGYKALTIWFISFVGGISVFTMLYLIF